MLVLVSLSRVLKDMLRAECLKSLFLDLVFMMKLSILNLSRASFCSCFDALALASLLFQTLIRSLEFLLRFWFLSIWLALKFIFQLTSSCRSTSRILNKFEKEGKIS